MTMIPELVPGGNRNTWPRWRSGDQGSAFSNRGAKHLFVRCAVELLFADRHHVVPCAAEQLHDAAAQILVKLEPHAAVTGTKRTRAVSAPKAIAARTSS